MFSADSSKETVRYSHGKRLLFHFGVFVEQQITPQYLIIKVIVWQRFNFSVLWERCAWQFSLRSGVLFRANVRPIIKNVWSHVSDSESGSSIFASRLFLLNDFFMLSGLFWPNWEQFLANCKKKKKNDSFITPDFLHKRFLSWQEVYFVHCKPNEAFLENFMEYTFEYSFSVAVISLKKRLEFAFPDARFSRH